MQQLANIEFFNYEGEVWYHLADGTMDRLLEQNTTVVDAVLHQIEEFYPGAFAALAAEYSRCKPNLPMYRYRIVKRFIRCNFGNIDNVQDIDGTGTWHLECVPCPLRGECRLENIVCRPAFNHKISDAEFRVLRLWYMGYNKDEIANALYLSVHTINNHIQNAFVRLGIHEKAEFFKYAKEHKLFEP